MRSRRRTGFGGPVLGPGLASARAGAAPVAVTARWVDCDAPDLERVDADLFGTPGLFVFADRSASIGEPAEPA